MHTNGLSYCWRILAIRLISYLLIISLRKKRMQRLLFVGLGAISLSLGVIGIVVPGLPTTPFVLLAAWLFIRGDETLHRWLSEHRIFGKYLQAYAKGVSKQVKWRISFFMWGMIALSCSLFLEDWLFRLVVILAGCIGTLVVWMLREPPK